MHINIRPATPADYPFMSAIHNLNHPDFPITMEEIAFWIEHQDTRCLDERWIVEDAERIVATYSIVQSPESFHPHKFWLGIDVHPDFQRQGIGTQLYQHALERLVPHKPESLLHQLAEDQVAGIRFLEARGFQNVWYSWESNLDVQPFDPTPYEDIEERLHAKGIEIKSIKQLEGDQERNRKLYNLDCEIAVDIPTLEPTTPYTYEYYLDNFLNNPELLADGYFVALDKGEYVGVTSFWKMKASAALFQSLTGVKRSHRRMGIALALKVRAIAFAKERGVPQIKTFNDHPNQGMIALNQKLGFVRGKAQYLYEKKL